MKKLIAILLFAVCLFIGNNSFCQNGSPIDCSKLPKNPTPHFAVTDDANIIDDSYQASLENQLRSFWIKDSIVVCVVTIPTLDGYDQFDYSLSIARCWGIGGKDNRGLLLFIGLAEKKISIRTGYGLEAYITDANSNQITDGMKSYFRSEDYSGGVKYAIDEIISTLGEISWSDRVEAAHKRQQAEEKEQAELRENLLDGLSVVGALALLALIIFLIYKAAQKATLRREMRVFVGKVRTEIDQGRLAIKQVSDGMINAASWIKREGSVFVEQSRISLDKAQDLLVQSKLKLNKDPEEAEALAREASMMTEKAFQTFTKLNENLRAKVKKIKVEAPVRLAEAQKVVVENQKTIQNYIEKGYNFTSYLNEQNDLSNLLQKYQETIVDDERVPKIYTDAEIVRNKSLDVFNKIQEILKQKALIDKELDPTVKEAHVLRGLLDAQKSILSAYKTKYPDTVWRDIDLKMKKVPEKLSPNYIASLQAEIKDLNSMAKQKFQSAAVKYTAFESFVKDVKQAYSDLNAIGLNQAKDEHGYHEKEKLADESLAKALDSTKDSDVSGETRNKAKVLAQKLRDVKIEAKKSLVDWVGAMLILLAIISDSKSIIKKAKEEISDADDERKRKARQAAAAKAKREENDYSPGISYSSLSSSSNSDSGFGGFGGGGFGGGGFGGGGADGGW